MAINVSVDNGNSYMKAVSPDREVAYINRLKEILDYDLDNLFGNSKSVVYEYNGRKYVVDERGTSSGSRNSNRYGEQYLLETLIAISQVTEHEKISLLLTLPCNHYNDKEIVKQIKEMFTKEHVLLINGVKHVYNIEKTSILPQSYLSAVDYIMNDDLTITNSKHLNSYLIIDIGGGTLDIVSTTGLKIDTLFSENLGTKDFKTKYLNMIRKNEQVIKDKAKFTIKDIGENLDRKIRRFDKVYDFTSEYNVIAQSIANEVSNIINEYGIDYSDYDKVIYVGGTSLLIEDYLYLSHNAIISDRAVTSNALGGIKYLNYKNKGVR